MSIQRKLQEAGKFQVSGKLDPIDSGVTFKKRAFVSINKADIATDASNVYNVLGRVYFEDYIKVRLMAILCQCQIGSKAGASAYQPVLYRANNGSSPVVAYDGNVYLSAFSGGDLDRNYYRPSTAVIAGSTVTKTTNIYLPLEQLIKFPEPLELSSPENGIQIETDISHPGGFTTGITLIRITTFISMWFELVR